MDLLNPYKKELREEYKKKQQENKDKHAEIVKKRLERKRAHTEILESSPKFIFPEEKPVLVPYNKYTVKINYSVICAKGKKDNIVSTPDKWYQIIYITFVANVKDLLVTKAPFGEIEANNKKN